MRHALIVGAIFVALLTWAQEATAASQQLKGRYAVTGTKACIASPFGFTDLKPNIAFYNTSGSLLGIRTYNGDGTGWEEATMVTIATPGIGLNIWPSSVSFRLSLKFTYKIDADGVLTTEIVPGTFNGIALNGPRTGQRFTYEGLSFKGLISGDKKVLNLATIDPEISTIQYYNTNGTEAEKSYEICHRSQVHTYIGQ